MIELTEIRSATLADEVEESLLNYIKRSGLTPGDILPKEEVLSEQLKVSRHIVREGISRLKTLGLVESRKRKGLILTRPNAFAGVLARCDLDRAYANWQKRIFFPNRKAGNLSRSVCLWNWGWLNPFSGRKHRRILRSCVLFPASGESILPWKRRSLFITGWC